MHYQNIHPLNRNQIQPPYGVTANNYRYPGGFGHIGPLGAGLVGFGLGWLGGELLDGPGYGYGAGYGAGYGPGYGYGAGFGSGYGFGPGFGPGYGLGYGPNFF
ncbi:hypothetical protein [Aquibacillus salsiterrae]|uniref:Spore coat protein n=1 Tax=Aquibacillus salsiterrae TaxID=2950439 RepID=A0A9X4AFP8_9BACI|nr:hypothetical protein [Aquibacillus salsiterrae]MDC3416243.1 hypothetical protein [Aquibacillus salsiterrae]